MPWVWSIASRPGAPLDARVARHQWPRRLCSGTISGVATRRYHGLLIAALPAPLGPQMMLNHLAEQLRLPMATCVQLGGEERAEQRSELPAAHYLTEFRLEIGLPVWRYEVERYRRSKSACCCRTGRTRCT